MPNGLYVIREGRESSTALRFFNILLIRVSNIEQEATETSINAFKFKLARQTPYCQAINPKTEFITDQEPRTNIHLSEGV